MIGQSDYTTDEIAQILGCCRNNTSRKMNQLAKRLSFLLTAYHQEPATNGSVNSEQRTNRKRPERADNIAEQITAVLETGGRLAISDRGRFKRYVLSKVNEVLKKKTKPNV